VKKQTDFFNELGLSFTKISPVDKYHIFEYVTMQKKTELKIHGFFN
jgi:hypothetical protein